MRCPICADINLIMSDRQGIEIDYCPTCRGVWLDRGELDKIIERSAENLPAPQSRQESLKRHHNDESRHGYRYKKKKSWLMEIFD
ncbi:MAG: hypothetical protein GY869_15030 [Planctomycetes bacterium]|nr:hypothetical protein [Planctomycetota bacterium]